MKFKKLILILLSLILSNLLIISAYAQDTERYDSKTIADEIVQYKLSEEYSTVQEWIDGELTDLAGISAEWYIFALSQSGNYNFSSYCASLEKYLSENTVSSAATRLKYALVLKAIGYEGDYITDTLEDSVGKLGIMSWVYGLHLLNNNAESINYTVDYVIDEIFALQLEDGGWALRGNAGDIDVTAMTVQSLAVYYESNEAVRARIEKALDFLSANQSASGGFISYGVENPESASQVIIALSSLGIDCNTDGRYIKNGNTAFDAIEGFKLKDGGYCHVAGGNVNTNATVQVFCAAIAYDRFSNSEQGLYILDIKDSELKEESEDFSNNSEESIEEKSEDVSEEETNVKPEDSGYKLYIIVAIVVIAAIIITVLFICKKMSKQNALIVIILVIVSILIVLTVNIQSNDEYYASDTSDKNVIGTVTMEIRCDNIVGKDADIPSSGCLLKKTEFEIESGTSVYDILVAASKQERFLFEINGGADVYVEGIMNIYEFDYGDTSGWIYTVNGEKYSLSCDSYILKDGDIIEWHYSLELGDDLK